MAMAATMEVIIALFAREEVVEEDREVDWVVALPLPGALVEVEAIAARTA